MSPGGGTHSLRGRVEDTGRDRMGAAGTAAPKADDRTVDVVEERLEIEKARQKAGEVRIGKEVETETVRRQVPFEREEVTVERERLDTPIAASAAAGHLTSRQDEIIVPIYREEVEVTTRPVIAERLRIRKRSVQESREVAGQVRRERAVVEGADTPGEGPESGPGRRRRA